MGVRVLFMPDKIIRGGSAPVYNENNEVIANINYQYFSMRSRLEITNPNGNIISCGKIKMFSFRPTWIITDEQENELGVIRQQFTLFSRSYVYQNNLGEEYRIEGNIWARKFQIHRDGNKVIDVSSVSEFFTLRPHSFEVTIYDDQLSTAVAISLVEGIRSLVELSDSNN